MLNIECVQRACLCGDLCSNQQFQRRNYARLKWFKYGKKDYGLKMLENISKGKFFIEYVGEVLDVHAYEARQREYALKGHRNFYFMTLNGSEIYPLVGPTKLIIGMPIDNYQWHEFFPKNETHNIIIVIAIWAPIILVYFMDTQIWYAIFATLFGGIVRAFSHLREIRTLGMLRSRFAFVPSAFSACLLPEKTTNAETERLRESFEWRNIAFFSQVWHEFINSMREEDLISNRDRDLLLVPYHSSDVSVIQWPLFLLASKIPIALDMAKDFKGKDDADLYKKKLRVMITCIQQSWNDISFY